MTKVRQNMKEAVVKFLSNLNIKGKIYACDWGHKDENQVWYDGEKIYKKVPLLKKGDVILIENPPLYKVREWDKLGMIILTCHTMSSRDHRERLGYPRLHHYKNEGHEVDAKVIYDLFQNYPDQFVLYKLNEMKQMHSNFAQIQKARIACGQRAWSLEAKDNTTAILEYLDKAEDQTVKAMDKIGQKDVVYKYLSNIKYVGPRTGGALRGLIDTTKFETASKLRRYSGLAVINGKVQKFRTGESGGFSPAIKSLLLSRISDCFIKSSSPKNGEPSLYMIEYNREKQRLQNIPAFSVSIDNKSSVIGDILAEDVNGFELGKTIYKHTYPKLKASLETQGRDSVLMNLSVGHIHARAVRKMMTYFLEDNWVISRQLEGFSTVQPYALSLPGHSHYRTPHYIPDELKPFNPVRDWGWIFAEGKRPMSEASEYVKFKMDGAN